GISRFSHSLLLVLLSPVVQFSMINFFSRARSRAHSLGIIPQPSRFVKGFFKSFLKTFFKPLSKGGSVAHYTTSQSVCQEVLENFFKFFLSAFIEVSFVILPKRFVEILNIISQDFKFVKRKKAFFHCAYLTYFNDKIRLLLGHSFAIVQKRRATRARLNPSL
ncbi:MAG: hypothetical protein IJW00_03175, partial [Clostridia bacterium]|nr:hypothetical protein [Clostridia bacterium]